MELPILEPLKDGLKFDFETLADNYEQTQDHWHWWWENKAKPDNISWPEVISDNEPILTPTCAKVAVDLCTHREFFDRTLLNLGEIPIRDALPRDAFRESISRLAARASVKLTTKPQLVITGGGYGSGKTATVNYMAEKELIPLAVANLVGADIFKQLIPEFNLIKAVGDGRANSVVHDECIALSDELIDLLIENGRSFVWDSSMSNKNATLRRVAAARKQGYEVTMVGVLAPLKIAIKQTMHRARQSRRFPPADVVIKSHDLFIQHFRYYFPYFDEVFIFANMDSSGHIDLVAEKKSGKELEILNQEVFNCPSFAPTLSA